LSCYAGNNGVPVSIIGPDDLPAWILTGTVVCTWMCKND